MCVCFLCFCFHLFWTSSLLDVPAGVTQEQGQTHTSTNNECRKRVSGTSISDLRQGDMRSIIYRLVVATHNAGLRKYGQLFLSLTTGRVQGAQKDYQNKVGLRGYMQFTYQIHTYNFVLSLPIPDFRNKHQYLNGRFSGHKTVARKLRVAAGAHAYREFSSFLLRKPEPDYI